MLLDILIRKAFSNGYEYFKDKKDKIINIDKAKMKKNIKKYINRRLDYWEMM